MSLNDSFQSAGNWKYLVISPSQGITKDLQQLLSGNMPQSQVLEIPVYPPSAGLLEVLNVQAPDLCLADVASDPDRGLDLIREIATMHAKTPVVALIPSNDTDLILSCLRAGAAEFLIHPFSSEQLEQVLGRLVAKNPTAKGNGKAGRIIAVVPAKGACGASTVASGLTFHWKRRASKMLLADLDPLTGTISFLLKLKSQFSFMDAVTLHQALDPDVWKSLIVPTQGIDVMLSPDSSVEGIHDIRDAAGILDYARWHYDTSIIDIGSPYGAWNLSTLRHADEILLVSTNELPALQATQRVLNYLDQNRVDRGKVKLIVNRYSRDVGLSKEVVETAIRCEVFQLLPSDFDSVQRAMIEGKPVPVSSPFGKGLSVLAEKLGGRPEPAKPRKSSSAWSGLLNLFSRTSH
ncbi:AAA family ATPase [Bryobacter aggregatus]|uniref:AAA family ATPase n=1 Tax=Bryobacter aggregatus TaxID=360054 RepID=UPI0004E0F1BA|nr:response regulator [Bryobacter aggregatus]